MDQPWKLAIERAQNAGWKVTADSTHSYNVTRGDMFCRFDMHGYGSLSIRVDGEMSPMSLREIRGDRFLKKREDVLDIIVREITRERVVNSILDAAIEACRNSEKKFNENRDKAERLVNKFIKG